MPAKSLLDTYALMVEKSPAYTIVFSGIILILIVTFFLLVALALSPGLRIFLREVIKGVRYSEGKLAYQANIEAKDTTIETDEKGNVKPPVQASETDDH